ncbi:hypothetical protein FPZ43_05150 [Mucilaginibacter pallidiroseus]|uniref:Uncharacterized protein n=1 Tax=Mucilaginibacter pallidiroseus TaxID=2599295 RepID=A0A563UGC3_9SPHI|nr:hypothetical protein [Mucilaginibacter pallidiroseus]TWR30329.1 hypothetical protein FPZ43_05150 [Mucilaginibacter pallidiroseus]
MIKARAKKVLLVAPQTFPDQLLAGYKNVTHISAAGTIFPSIHALKPDVIFFDNAHVGADLERVLRRLQTNQFYKNIKIYLYKQSEQVTVDSLLKTLGVDHIIYKEDLQRATKSSATLTAINNVIDASLVRMLAGLSTT